MAKNTYEIDEQYNPKNKFGSLRRSLKYVKKEKWRLFAAFILSVSDILIATLGPIFTMYVIDTVIPKKDYRMLGIITVLYLLSIVAIYIISYFQQIVINIAGQNIVAAIREDLYAHMQNLSFSYFDDRPHGKILVRVIHYVSNVSNFLSGGLVNLFVQIFSIFILLFYMLATSFRLTLVVLAGLPILVVFIYWVMPRIRALWRKINNKSSNLNAYYNESVLGVRVTQGFTREQTNEEIERDLSSNLKTAWIKTVQLSLSIGPVCETLTMIVFCAVMLFGTVYMPGITIGVVIAMTNYSNRFWMPITQIGGIYNEITNVASYLERIFEMMDEPIEIKDSLCAVDIPTIDGDIEFKNVTFSYEDDKVVLNNLSFMVNKGESIALVGPTGAGKTTIVNLISRFYDITDGDILIDGRSIKDITIKSLRSNMGIMLQDPYIFSGTIADNIRYGKLDATDEEIRNAAKTVAAHEFIMNMPKGYDTVINERGAMLSAGQRQLIAFARTVISDPKILILDEATSSVDTETELCLQEGIKGLISGRTSFIIAHRLSTIKDSDRIFYINNQGITESGTHKELLRYGGDYSNLYNSQQIVV